MLLNNFNDKKKYYKPNLTFMDINFIDTDVPVTEFYKCKPLIHEFEWILTKNYDLLKKYASAPINIMNLAKQTPLMLAARIGDDVAIEILRHKDAGRCDKSGRIARDILLNKDLDKLLSDYE